MHARLLASPRGWALTCARPSIAKIQTLAFGNLDNYDASSLVTRMTTDITVIQNAVGNGFRPMVRGPVTLIVGLVYALDAVAPARHRLCRSSLPDAGNRARRHHLCA